MRYRERMAFKMGFNIIVPATPFWEGRTTYHNTWHIAVEHSSLNAKPRCHASDTRTHIWTVSLVRYIGRGSKTEKHIHVPSNVCHPRFEVSSDTVDSIIVCWITCWMYVHTLYSHKVWMPWVFSYKWSSDTPYMWYFWYLDKVASVHTHANPTSHSNYHFRWRSPHFPWSEGRSHRALDSIH